MTKLKRTIVWTLAVATLMVALAAGGLVASRVLQSAPAEAKGDACTAACEETFGQCYRDTADRAQCTKAYKQCLATCING